MKRAARLFVEGQGQTLVLPRALHGGAPWSFLKASAARWGTRSLQVRRKAARVHPASDRPVIEVSNFIVRKRGRSIAGGTSHTEEHAWELVQVAPQAFVSQDYLWVDVKCRKVQGAGRRLERGLHVPRLPVLHWRPFPLMMCLGAPVCARVCRLRTWSRSA